MLQKCWSDACWQTEADLLVSDVCGVKDNEIVVSLKYRTCPGVCTSELRRSRLLLAFKNAFTLSSLQTSAALRMLVSTAALSDAQTAFVRKVCCGLFLILAERCTLTPSETDLFLNICCRIIPDLKSVTNV